MELQILGWIADVFFIFTLHILYKKILGVKYKSKVVLLAGWIACFILWNCSSYFWWGNSLGLSFFTIVIQGLVIILLYRGNFTLKATLLVFVFVMLAISEVVTMFIFLLLNGSGGEVTSSALYFQSSISKIVAFLFIKIVNYFSLKKQQRRIGLGEWVEIFLVPLSSVAMICTMRMNEQGTDYKEVIMVTLLFVINISTYFIYQRVQENAEKEIQHQSLVMRSKYYETQFHETEQLWRRIRAIRHDIANRYILEQRYLEMEEYGKLQELYSDMVKDIMGQENVIISGNVGMDAIVSYKVECAKELGITVKHHIFITMKARIRDEDLSVLLGNLFDNAIEALKDMPAEDKWIKIDLKTDATAFFVQIKNPYKGKRTLNNEGEYITIKEDKENHGFGLRAVKQIVEKYDGNMEIKNSQGIFDVKAILYMDCEGTDAD